MEVRREVLRMEDVDVELGQKRLLNHISLYVAEGELLGISGMHGCGKAELGRAIAGRYPVSGGRIFLSGSPDTQASPISCAQLLDGGVRYLSANSSLIASLSVADNIFAISRSRRLRFLYDRGTARARTEALLREAHLRVTADTPVGRLAPADHQIVEIIKALTQNARLIVLDNTARYYGPKETSQLLDFVHSVAHCAFVYIGNLSDMMLSSADRVLIMRDGRICGHLTAAEYSPARLKRIATSYEGGAPAWREPAAPTGKKALELSLDGHNLTVYGGEIVGLIDPEGKVRARLSEFLTGARYGDGLKIGENTAYGYADAVEKGLAMATERQIDCGLFRCFSLEDNLALGALKRVSRWGVINRRMRRYLVKQTAEWFQSEERAPSTQWTVLRALLARAMLSNPRAVVLDLLMDGYSPGNGKDFVETVINLAGRGIGVLCLSANLALYNGLCDRIILVRPNGERRELRRESPDYDQELERLHI